MLSNPPSDRFASCEVDGVLAPSLRQCLEASELLHVYMKDRVRMSERMADLVDDFNVSPNHAVHRDN